MTVDRMTLALATGPIELTVDAATHVGSVRTANEDSYLASAPVFLVADGMGGHDRGDAASRAAVDVFARRIRAGRPTDPGAVLDAVAAANRAVRRLSRVGASGTRIAGTTLAGVALVDAGDDARQHWMVFNVGDSRVYTWDGRMLEQVTVDHSAVQELVDAGLITAEQALGHPERNVITRALGAEEAVDADVWLLPVRGAQTFVICSDGLSKDVDDEVIAATLAGAGVDDGLAHELVGRALAGGGRDNVTVLVVTTTSDVDVDAESTADRRGAWATEDTAPRARGGA